MNEEKEISSLTQILSNIVVIWVVMMFLATITGVWVKYFIIGWLIQ